MGSLTLPQLRLPDAGTCLQPYVKGLTIDVNYIFGSCRMDDVWLDK
jgi:hypothetical protein